jgi:hypothetical protein
MRVFENSVLSEYLDLRKGNEGTGSWRRLQSENFVHCVSLNIIRATKIGGGGAGSHSKYSPHFTRKSLRGCVRSGALRGGCVMVGGLKGCYWWKTV